MKFKKTVLVIVTIYLLRELSAQDASDQVERQTILNSGYCNTVDNDRKLFPVGFSPRQAKNVHP